MECCSSCNEKTREPKRLRFRFTDWVKTKISWILAYRKTYEIEPGLYFTGNEYDIDSPVLVTCNYHMTVFLLWRIIRRRKVRVLVIDTKGINVWCSAGKGQFSAKEILAQLEKYDPEILVQNGKLEIILPKLAMSGVRLSELRKAEIVPKIGPVYAHNLPQYLDGEQADCDDDVYKFNLRNRLFTLLPSFIQFTKYIVPASLVLLIFSLIFKTGYWWQIIPAALSVPILYIILFPFLPTKSFSLKGISLFIFQTIILFLILRNKLPKISGYLIAFHLLYFLGTNIFFGLYYTGSSGVSNYSLVKKEIITFLPIVFFLYIAALVMIILQGVLQ